MPAGVLARPHQGIIAALATVLLASRLAQAAQPRLLVFLHVAVKQRAFQGELQNALAGIDVTAVGRIGDFDRALNEGADAVLTLPLVLAAHGLGSRLHGRHQGEIDEKYALVAVDTVPDPARVQTIGALDLLGREGTNDFVQKLVGGKRKVERVTKVEDLLPLLQMQRVDAILLPSRLVAELKASSRLNLTPRELTSRVELPALASTGAAGDPIVRAVSKLPLNLSSALGVDEWR